jgi:hypothetical protein
MMRIAVQIPTRTSQLVDLGMLFFLSSSQQKAKSKDHSPMVKQKPFGAICGFS